ncbi:ABC transporter ATP-binding protein [Anaerolinea thermophila]|uniref:ABC transporter ATP-binding protein n=1 Tax=Anaerolinea thermophila (strain DSM 14523 / JCM 11388 / NBRC 100420 / UNI-1) TaxID=926569 RepID=E8MZA9_ANATU|nr:ABC transporter ATP-binding protein [Anaerolinea thermophila]BAJ62252.1 putative ABC transporter ATP-binding protein [Anaerolinea thermophila UNI-1]
MKTLLEAHNLSKLYGNGRSQVVALKDVSISLFPGECLALMGPSGSGKSTLLSILGLIIRPTSGCVLVQGKPVEEDERSRARLRNEFFGYIHQEFAVIENETVEKNVMIPLQYARIKPSRQERQSRILQLLKQLNLDWAVHKNVSFLSGGERQRVAIARAIINHPSVILADEPTAALDRKSAEEIMGFVLSMRDQGCSVLIATHDERIAKTCDRVLHLVDGRLL